MADLRIQNPSITSAAFAAMLEMSAGTDVITAISGHPLGGSGGGGTSTVGYWRPSVDDYGDISWAWSLESTATVPDTTNIKGPSGTNGVDGKNGADGKDGVDGISPTFTITPTAGGTHITISGAQGENSFDILSGAQGPRGETGPQGIQGETGPAGADGSDGTSIYLESVIDAENGKQITLGLGNGETSAFVIPSGEKGDTGEQGPQGEKGDKGDDATPLTATTATISNGTQVTISYTSGGDPLAQFNVLNGASGQNGKDGTNGTSVYLDNVSTVAGGTQVTLGWGTSDTSAFVIPSGAAGTNGKDGVSPTITTTELSPSEQHPQGGFAVTITDETGSQTINIWNGNNGAGATVRLIEGTGIKIEANGSDYTIGVSADYALKSELPDVSDMATQTWVEEQGYLNSIPNTYATKEYANETSANALSAAETWVNQQNFVTSAGLAADTRYEMTNTGWTSAIKIQVDTQIPTENDGILHIILES